MDGYKRVVDRYLDKRSKKEERARKFLNGERPYMIYQTPSGNVWGDIRSSEQSFIENIKYIDASMNIPSDHLPLLEPWFGTGVFANMYGCEYVWRQGEAPAVHYKYLSLEEIRDIKKPNWEDGEIAHLIMDTIRLFKSRTGDAIPIVWTDTQSASDTATLVLDASEVFIGCMAEPGIVMRFMKDINELVIEFSRAQAELIGNALLKPGHIMLTNVGFKGMSIADDNLAVASPKISREFNLPLDEEVGKAMGGVAIHSCGKWTHTMPFLREIVPSCVAIDCAVDKSCGDLNPNTPEQVKDAMAGSGIAVHARMTGETEAMLETVKRLFHKDIKLIIRPTFIDMPTAEKNYTELEKLLTQLYSDEVR